MRTSILLKTALALAFAAPAAYATEYVPLTCTFANNDRGSEAFYVYLDLDGVTGQYKAGSELTLTTASGSDVGGYFAPGSDDNLNTCLIMYPGSPLSEDVYYLNFPQGSVLSDVWATNPEYGNLATVVTMKLGDPGDGSGPIGGGDEDNDHFTYVTVYPSEGGTVDYTQGYDLNFVALTFGDAVTPVADAELPYFTCGLDTHTADEVRGLAAVGAPKQVNIVFDNSGTWAPGVYTLTVPEGIVALTSDPTKVNKAFTLTYNYVGTSTGGGGGEEKDLSIESATLTIGGTPFDLMSSETKVPLIQHLSTLSVTTNLDSELEELIVTLLDVTGLSETQWVTAEGVFVAYIDKIGGKFNKELWNINGYKLYEDHQYVLKVEGYYLWNGPVQDLAGTTYGVPFEGAVESYKFSDVSVLSISPEPGSMINVGDAMVITFSDPVTVLNGDGQSGFALGSAGWSNLESVSSNADKTVWTLKMRSSDITGDSGKNCVQCHVYAVDQQGRVVRPAQFEDNDPNPAVSDVFNYGLESNSYFCVCYSNYDGAVVITVSPTDTEALESLSQVRFSAGGQEINYNWGSGYTTLDVLDARGNKVAALLLSESEVLASTGSADDPKCTLLGCPVDPVITEAGSYTVELPWGAFVIGRELSSKNSAPATYTFNVGEVPALPEVSFTFPETGEVRQSGELNNNTLNIGVKTAGSHGMVKVEGDGDVYYAISTHRTVKKQADLSADMQIAENGEILLPYGTGTLYLQLLKDGYASQEVAYPFNVYLNETVGVNVIEISDEAAAEYFTLQGVKVAEPGKGLYIKVVNGRSSKVIR